MRALVVTLIFACLACGTATVDPVPGVRLGMTPRDVRDRFDADGAGVWKTSLATGAGANDDTVLEWTASRTSTATSAARFEFHLGMLVAVRAHLREGEPREHVDSTAKTVTLRAPADGGTDVTLLARDCPTHHDEAEALALRAAAGGR